MGVSSAVRWLYVRQTNNPNCYILYTKVLSKLVKKVLATKKTYIGIVIKSEPIY